MAAVLQTMLVIVSRQGFVADRLTPTCWFVMQQQQRSNISLYHNHNHNRVRLKKSKIEQVSGGESQPPADFLGGTAPISLSLER
jgi:hypothetical protein